MQISRHWRLNPQRYRLQGIRYANGEVSLQTRPVTPASSQINQPETDVAISNQHIHDIVALSA